jgi:hypothetical protein
VSNADCSQQTFDVAAPVALQATEVTPGQRALIIPQGAVAPEESGTLVIEDSERRFPVSPDVDAIGVIPLSAP